MLVAIWRSEPAPPCSPVGYILYREKRRVVDRELDLAGANSSGFDEGLGRVPPSKISV